MHECNICGKNLASNQRLRTHTMSHHGLPTIDPSIDDSESVISSEDTIAPTEIDSDTEMEEEEDTNSEIEEEDTDDEEGKDAWLWVFDKLNTANMDEEGKLAGKLMKDGETRWNKKKMVKAIRNEVEELVEKVGKLKNTLVYDEIEREKRRIHSLGNYSEEEAMKIAWENRRHLVKEKVIDKYMLPPDHEDSDSESQ